MSFLGPRLEPQYVYIPKSLTVTYIPKKYLDSYYNRGTFIKNKYNQRKHLVLLRDEDLYQRLLIILYTNLNDWGLINSMPKEKVDYVTETLAVLFYMNFFNDSDEVGVDKL